MLDCQTKIMDHCQSRGQCKYYDPKNGVCSGSGYQKCSRYLLANMIGVENVKEDLKPYLDYFENPYPKYF